MQVTDLLKKQGLLHATPGSKRRGFTEKGLPKFSVPDSSEVRERLQQEIFDPFVKIAHHVSSIDSTSRVRGSKANNQQYTFSGASQLIPESSMPSIPVPQSTSRADGTGTQSTMGDSQLNFLSDGQQHGEADSGDRNQGGGAWNAGSSQGSKRSLPGTVEGLPWSSVPRQTGSQPSTDAMDTTCQVGGQGGGQRAGKRRKMSNIIKPVEVGEPSDEESS